MSEEAQTSLPVRATLKENTTWTAAGWDRGAVWRCGNDDEGTISYRLSGTYYYQIWFQTLPYVNS